MLYRLCRWMWRGGRWLVLGVARCILAYPRGTFSLYGKLLRGEAGGRVYFTTQDIPPFEADSLVKKAALGQDGFQPWPVFWAKVDHAVLTGSNLLLLDDRRRACAEGMHTAEYKHHDESYNARIRGNPIKLAGNWTSIVGRLDEGYWHFLIDAVARLHVLPDIPSDTRILIRPNPAPWQREVFDMLGIGDRVIEAPGGHLEIEHFYFSSFTSMTGAWNPFAIEFLRRTCLPFAKLGAGCEKLYLRRGVGWTRGIVNEDELCKFLAGHGWSIVRPETMTVAEQMGMFMQANAICSVHGSALTNLLWASKGCKVLELCADNFILGGFEWLARYLEMDHDYLMFEGDPNLMVKVDLERLASKLAIMGMADRPPPKNDSHEIGGL